MQTHLTKLFLAFFSIIGLLTLPYLLHLSYSNYEESGKDYSKLQVAEWEEESKMQRIGEIMKEEFEKTKDPSTNTVPRERLLDARKFIEEKKKSGNKAAIPNLNWEERGPNNIGGRTRAILIDANDPSHSTVWAGSVSGGLWKTTNFFAEDPQWQQIDDFFDNMAITCIVQDPQDPNHIYFGTGEGWFNIDAARGLGIWESLDGGDTWNQMPSTNNNQNFKYIQDIIIDQNQNLYAATREGGVQKLSANSDTWVQVLGSKVGKGDRDRVADLEISSTGDLYATQGIFSEGSVWKSPAGANVGDLETWIDITPEAGYKRIELAVAPSDPNRLYILMQGTTNSVTAVYRSDNAGQDWIKITTPPSSFTRGQAWYNLIAAVDPNQPDAIYIGGVDAYCSLNAGSSWTRITSWTSVSGYYSGARSGAVHADQHAIVFFPGESTRAIWGTDGGIYYTEDLDYNYTSRPLFYNKNYGYNVTQFYSVAMHPDKDANFFLAGAQDNGTQRFTSSGINETVTVRGGDGGYCHIDQEDPNYQFAAYTHNNLGRSTNGGQSFSSGIYDNSGSFINVTDYDNDAHHLYAAHSSGKYLRWNNARTSSDYDIVEAGFSGFLGAITCDPATPNRIWVGWFGGIGFIDDAHTNSPTTTIIGNVPNSFRVNSYIMSIDIDRADPDHIIFAVSNYGMPSVWEIKNATSANPIWIQLDSGTNLPDMPVRSVLFNPTNSTQALIGTEMGVWSTNLLNGLNTEWAPSNNGLANVRIDMMEYRTSDNMIVAATHGRGIFTTSAFETVQVSFAERASTVNEKGTEQGGNCNEMYRDLYIPIIISEAPNHPIEIEIGLRNTTSATANRDFDLQNSSDKVLFTPTSDLTQYATIRLLDDVTQEIDEVIDLELLINGNGGGIQRGGNLVHTINIMDDEPLPTVEPLEETTFYVEDFAQGFNNGIQTTHSSGQHDWEYTYTGPQSYSEGQITSPTSNNGFALFDSDGISIGNYAEDAVLQLPVINCGVYKDVKLEFYQQHCRLNEMTTIEISNDGINYTSYAINDQLSYNDCTGTQDFQRLDISEIADNQRQVYIRFRYQGNVDFWWQIDDIALTGKQLICPETIANKSRTAYIGAYETAHFYSDNGQIIASVNETDGLDMGCVTLSINQAGNDRQVAPFLQGGSESFSDKVYGLVAEQETSYELVLYYTDEELAVWNAPLPLTILKSRINMDNAEASDVSLVPSELINSTHYAPQQFTTFRGRFSGDGNFALTDANQVHEPLAIELIAFTGEVIKDYIQLTWKTASEAHADHFIVEHSTDGVHFNFLRKVAAIGNSREANTYLAQDWQPNAGTNYYRLTEVDSNGNSGEPAVITVEFTTDIKVQVAPNPIQNQLLKIQLTTDVAELLRIEVYNTLGQSIYLTKQFAPVGSQNLSLPLPELSTGIYLMHVKGKNLDSTLQFLVK